MPIGVLTAALQELTPRERRDKDPDRAIEDWLGFAREIGVDIIQLSAALHPSESDVPAEAMLDPVANTLDLRKPFDKARASRVRRRRQGDEGRHLRPRLLRQHAPPRPCHPQKEDGLHAQGVRRRGPARRRGGVRLRRPQPDAQHGREPRAVRADFIPLLKEAKARGLQYRVEQCPMPGWTTGDNFHNNIAYAPGPWIALHRICEKHGVGDQFRIHYDPSHAILMGQDTRSLFQYLKDAGYGFLIAGFHVKGQVIDAKGLSGWGYGGQTMERGDWKERQTVRQARRSGQGVAEADRPVRARAARHRETRSARLLAEPHRRLARSPARRARALAARPGQTRPSSSSTSTGPRASRTGGAPAHPAGLGRVHPQDRRGGCLHVRAPERGARRRRASRCRADGRDPYRS